MKGNAGLANGVGHVAETRKSMAMLSDELEIDVVAKASTRPQLPRALHRRAAVGTWRH